MKDKELTEAELENVSGGVLASTNKVNANCMRLNEKQCKAKKGCTWIAHKGGCI